ncbi:MAG TPA: inorganic phosphate transporter [Pseudothermotoga sp.]|uniref:inorganic phosphate transporter n=1 Tax=Thermotoga profunda TaxID=1508420 RepID=UPI0009E2ED2F|nr:inorganic phosphate transporter [Thermotoga profunda]
MSMLYLIPGIALGLVLGANDGASIFGPLVAVGSIKRRTAVLISSLFVILGAIFGGREGIKTLNTLTTLDQYQISIAILSAAITVILMISLKAPASVSQAVVGSLIGIGLIFGPENVRWFVLLKIILVWVFTPLLASFLAFVVYRILAVIFRHLRSIYVQDLLLRYASFIAVCYSAYSLGANNVANVAGSFVEMGLDPFLAQLVGGVCIGFGVLIFSKRMTFVIGKSIILLDHFSSLVASISMATNVFIFSLVGVPISATQSTVGAVIGAGMSRGERLSSRKTKVRIVLGLTLTPCVGGIISVFLYLVLRGG